MTHDTLQDTLALLLLAGLVGGCAPKRPSELNRPDAHRTQEREQRPVAMIRGEPLTAAEFNEMVKSLPPAARARYSTMERQGDLLNAAVLFRGIVHQGRAEGMAQAPVVRHQLENTLAQVELERRLRAAGALVVSREELKAAYAKRYPAPPEGAKTRVALVIRVPDRAEAEVIRARALRDPAQQVNQFRRLAARYSADTDSRSKGGWFGELHSYLPEPDPTREALRVALFKAAADAITQPIQRDDAWWLVTTHSERDAKRVPLDEVERALNDDLVAQKKRRARQTMMKELRAGASITIDRAALASVKPPLHHDAARVKAREASNAKKKEP